MMKYLQKYKLMRSVISATLMFTFTWYFCLQDAQAVTTYEVPSPVLSSPSPSNSGQFASLDIDTFSIPSYLGEVKYLFTGDPKRILIHIQDAHANYFAQTKISSIIDYLNEEFGINMVNLEGGAGEYDLSPFTSITGTAIRREVADHFLKTGEINGAEFNAINNPEKVTLRGIEDKDLYLANLNVYRNSLVYKEEVDKFLKELTHILNNLKRHMYAKELLKIDISYAAYKANNMDFREYLEFLIKKAKESGIDVRMFTNLYLLVQAMEREDGIDFKKANTERNLLVDELKKGLSQEEIRELVSQSIDFKTKKTSRKVFYNYLLRKAHDIEIPVERFPELSNYIVYVGLYDAVDQPKVIEELDRMEKDIKEPLFKNDRERELDKLSRCLVLMKNLFNLSLTKADYQYYLENKNLFEVASFQSFINNEALKYNITSALSDNIGLLDEYREKMSKFYEYSFKRDEVFVENIRFSKISDEIESAIIMTGGFHTENLCGLLEKANISYVSLMPKFTSDEDYKSPYFALLAGEQTDLERMLSAALNQGTLLQIASKLSSVLGNDVWGRRNLDVFRAAILVQEQIAKGRDIESIERDGENIRFHMKDRPLEEIPLQKFFHWIHDTDQIDPYLEAGYASEKYEEVNAHHPGITTHAAGRLQGIANKMNNPKNKEKIQSVIDQIKNKEVSINLVDIGEANFDGHAGGRGIHVNMKYKGSRETIIAIIMHEAIAGISGDHFIALDAELERTELAAKALDEETLFERPVWEMDKKEERELAARDFAETYSGNITLEIKLGRIPFQVGDTLVFVGIPRSIGESGKAGMPKREATIVKIANEEVTLSFPGSLDQDKTYSLPGLLNQVSFNQIVVTRPKTSEQADVITENLVTPNISKDFHDTSWINSLERKFNSDKRNLARKSRGIYNDLTTKMTKFIDNNIDDIQAVLETELPKSYKLVLEHLRRLSIEWSEAWVGSEDVYLLETKHSTAVNIVKYLLKIEEERGIPDLAVEYCFQRILAVDTHLKNDRPRLVKITSGLFKRDVQKGLDKSPLEKALRDFIRIEAETKRGMKELHPEKVKFLTEEVPEYLEMDIYKLRRQTKNMTGESIEPKEENREKMINALITEFGGITPGDILRFKHHSDRVKDEDLIYRGVGTEEFDNGVITGLLLENPDTGNSGVLGFDEIANEIKTLGIVERAPSPDEADATLLQPPAAGETATTSYSLPEDLIAEEKAVISIMRPGIPAAILTPLSSKQWLEEQSSYRNGMNEVSRTIMKKYGPQVKVFFYERANTESFNAAYQKVIESDDFTKNDQAMLMAYVTTDMEQKAIDEFKALDRVAGVVKEELDKDQYIDEVFHVILGLGVIDYARTNRDEVGKRIKALLQKAIDNPGDLKDMTMQDLLAGVALLKIKRIDVDEDTQERIKARQAVLIAL